MVVLRALWGCVRGVNGVVGTGAWRGTEVLVEGKGYEGWEVKGWKRDGWVWRKIRGLFGREESHGGGGQRSEQEVLTERSRLLG